MTTTRKYEKVTNWMSEKVHMDTLHQKSHAETLCTKGRCMGSTMAVWPQRPPNVPRPKEELLTQANDFIEQYYESLKTAKSQSHTTRLSEIENSIEMTGTYELTTAELTFGVKLAWRNAPRCLGRIQWSKIQVFDARHISTARDMFESICSHIKYSTNGGNIRSAITVFPHRVENRGDYRVWNAQLFRYAGYKLQDGTIVGDAASLEFTDLCIKLGWTPKYGRFDVLPLLLSASGSDPELFPIPPELIMEVDIIHPDYPWFEEMGLKWYVIPAVSNMMLDCGGLEFTASPFNGWYMGTEIGARDFCDAARYNLLDTFGAKMGLDTKNLTTLWKDRALVEVNVAVLYSFQKCGVTISDHHTLSESFMKFMGNEHKLRGGCPGDWVWLVPPISGSITPVFHQEMLNYKLKPQYEYQDNIMKTFVWEKDRGKKDSGEVKRKIHFRQVARAAVILEILMRRILARRVKCTILYATETGRSEDFAKTLCEIFKHTFHAKVLCVDEYDAASLEHESLLLVVTSTFGNGEPPENARVFARQLNEISKLGKVDSQFQFILDNEKEKSDINANTEHHNTIDNVGLLKHVRFGVFALGSRAYPYFAAFGHSIDKLFNDMGAERILAVGEGDELSGQEESFKEWAQKVFVSACDAFNLGNDVNVSEATGALSRNDYSWSPDKFRLATLSNQKEPDLCEALSKMHSKKVVPCILTSRKQLQSNKSDRQTILVKLDTHEAPELGYVPGDHVCVYPANDTALVSAILPRLFDAPPPDQVICTEISDEGNKASGSKTWTRYEKLPTCSLRMALTYFLDLTTPPSQYLLKQLSSLARSENDRVKLESLVTDSAAYENWRHDVAPNFNEFLDLFPSLHVPPSVLLTQFPVMHNRFYSISSSARMVPGEIHATITVLKYRTRGGKGPQHEGVSSGWLNKCPLETIVPCVVRSAPSFHLPEDSTSPVVMVGPGTGIAPFRSFWFDRLIDTEKTNVTLDNKNMFGDMLMYFGCRSSELDHIYKDELEIMQGAMVLSDVQVAFSREPGTPKVYVQDLLQNNAENIYKLLATKGGHFYVCGDVNMAHDVKMTLESILMEQGNLSRTVAKQFISNMRETNRFHEDIFGVGNGQSGDEHKRSDDQIQQALEYLKHTHSEQQMPLFYRVNKYSSQYISPRFSPTSLTPVISSPYEKGQKTRPTPTPPVYNAVANGKLPSRSNGIHRIPFITTIEIRRHRK